MFEAARILDAFRTKLAGQAHLTFNPGVLLGGTSVDFNKTQARGTAFGKTNVVAEHVTVAGDLRALTPDQFAQAKKTMEAIVAESLPRTKATIVFDEGYPPLAPAPGNTELLALYDTVSRGLGLGAVEAVSPDKAGAADVSFVADKVPMIIDADRAEGPRRSHAGRDGRSDDAAGSDQARGRHARAACDWGEKASVACPPHERDRDDEQHRREQERRARQMPVAPRADERRERQREQRRTDDARDRRRRCVSAP